MSLSANRSQIASNLAGALDILDILVKAQEGADSGLLDRSSNLQRGFELLILAIIC